MKRFIFLLCAMFYCAVAIAEQITINWHRDNRTYVNTTCEIGGNVTLPPLAPTKRGYVFRGWVAEHFDRGTFVNWDSVPYNTNGYSVDIYNNSTPQRGDYIIVEDASDYTGLLVKTHSTGDVDASIDVTILDTQETYNYLYTKVGLKTRIGDTNFYFQYVSLLWRLSADVPMIINNVTYSVGSEYTWRYDQYRSFIAKEANANSLGRYTGTWKFVYRGDWEKNGIAGWEPEEQIVSE